MSQRYFTWQVLSFLGAWLFFVGLFFIPSDVVLGLPMNVLAVLVGFVAFLAGLLWGLALAVQRFRRPGSLGERLGLTAPTGYAAGDDDDGRRRRGRDDGGHRPRFNVDGTPMLTAGADVMGKSYGDDGHRYDAGSFSSGGSFGSDYGSSGNSRW
jgi:hypothetical protein